jgi:hypothetical protein
MRVPLPFLAGTRGTQPTFQRGTARKWIERSRRVDLDGHMDWFCLPFTGTPTEAAWRQLLGRVVRLHEQKPIALLVIDSLSNRSPMRSENDAMQMLRLLQPPSPLPLPEGRPETAASASPSSDPLPARTPDPVAPLPSEAPVRLPYPYNTMNAADVPEKVWQRARAAKRNG